MINRFLLFLLLIAFSLLTYGQTNEVEIDISSSKLFYSVNSKDIDYDDFILTIKNIDTQDIEDFTLIEEDGYAIAQLQRKYENKISYIICNSKKSKRKKTLTFTLENKNKRQHEFRLLFFKNIVNIDHVPKDTIITYGILGHAPLLVSNFHIPGDYSIRDIESNPIIEYRSLRLLSVYLKRLKAGKYSFFDGDKLLFKFKVGSPKNEGERR